MKRSFIVGIGASAGGLEAFTQLLQNLPVDSGLAFVLIQHLDPAHPSALAAILSKATPMPLLEATDDIPVKPNHVYIISPNTVITIVGGCLKVCKPQVEHGSRRAVDIFFESLAQDQGEGGIGVILSGTGSDGTLGLEAIRAEGGITFAQDASAKYDGMPRSAIDASCVDAVLSLQAIAEELVRIGRHIPGDFGISTGKPAGKASGRTGRSREALASGDAYGKIMAVLRQHSGVDFAHYKPATFQRRVNRRMLLLKIPRPESYLKRLKADKTELDELYQDVLINVTAFFRNPDAFQALGQAAFPALLKGRSANDSIRLWVPGCSTGQEAYSLVMALLEATGDEVAIPIQMFGTDLNEKLLEKARSGLYSSFQVQDVSPERLRRFFVEEAGAYRVAKSIRERCVFAKHDVMADPPFSRMDVISCRNMMIYIDQDAQAKIISSFHYALKPKGILFLGASETIGGSPELFTALDKKHRIYLKAPGPSRPLPYPLPAPVARSRPVKSYAVASAGVASGESDVRREADRVSLNLYVPSCVLINDSLEILQFRGDTALYLRPPRGRASLSLLKMARDGLMLPLRTALNKARKTNQRVRADDISINSGGRGRRVNLKVVPLKNLKERHWLVFFEVVTRRSSPLASPAEMSAGDATAAVRSGSSRAEARETVRLREELSETRDYMQSLQEKYEAASEELQASSEEIQSSNEELQSINEELETSKEELESTNEELTTVNEEMANRNADLTRLTGDLKNLHVSVDMAILRVGSDLCIRRFTPQAEKLFNLIASDVGRPLGAVKTDFDLPELEELITDVIKTLSVRAKEVQDRAGRWYSLRARPYVTIDNKIDGAVLTMVDITDLKMSLSESEAIVETSPPMLILDGDLRVKKVNRSFCEAFKVSFDETQGHFLYELGNGQWNIPKLKTLLGEILPRDKAVTNFEVDHEFQTIGMKMILISGRELDWGAFGKTILISILDITERKKALKEIEQYNAELEQRVRERTAELTATNQELEAFAYSVAHDLRNPLRGIEGFSRILAKDYGDRLDETGKNYCERIRTSVYRMSHLIDSLLELARLTRTEIRREEVDLSHEVRVLSREFNKKDPGREVEFVVAPDVKVVGDGRLLRIALANLLDNAWKFTSKHPRARLEFGITQEDGSPVYFVRDDGAGFNMAFAEKLFQTFQRLHTPEEFPGTGIGLTIAQRIVKRHGGRIWADGAVERGATLYFSLSRPERPAAQGLLNRRKLDRRALVGDKG